MSPSRRSTASRFTSHADSVSRNQPSTKSRAVVEQTVAAIVFAHLVGGHGELVPRVVQVAAVGGVAVAIGWRETAPPPPLAREKFWREP